MKIISAAVWITPIAWEGQPWPKLRRDPGYLRREHIRVLDRNGRPVNSAAINWQAVGSRPPYILRQDPGPHNAPCSKACVNPAHMWPTTHRDNVLSGRAPTAQNARKTHCPKGHPYDAENTDFYRNGRGRRCRTCYGKRKRSQKDKAQRLSLTIGENTDDVVKAIAAAPPTSFTGPPLLALDPTATVESLATVLGALAYKDVKTAVIVAAKRPKP